MKIARHFNNPRILLATAVIVLGLCIGPLRAGSVSAHYGVCMDDPIIVLSNGVKVQMSATISDTATDVSSIQYALHVPTTVTGIVSITYTSRVTSHETFTLYKDENPGNYDTYTYVTAYSGIQTIPVTAQDLVSGVTTPVAQGHTYQQLHVHAHIS
jgi:hypothetical protein